MGQGALLGLLLGALLGWPAAVAAKGLTATVLSIRDGDTIRARQGGRQVTLDVKTTDRYGRSVAEVISGINLNLAMVEDGQAFAYRQYLGGCDAKE